MALQADYSTVYVAFYFVFLTSLNFTSATPGGGSSNVLSLLQPYDFLYYSGVRAYFGGEWAKSAELLEKSIVTKESLFRVRRKCHDDCVAAGREALNKLGKLWGIRYTVRLQMEGYVCSCSQSVSQWCAKWSALIAVGNSLNESDSHEWSRIHTQSNILIKCNTWL